MYKWHFEDDFESYEQFVFEDARSAVSPIFFWLLRIQGYLTSLLNVDCVYWRRLVKLMLRFLKTVHDHATYEFLMKAEWYMSKTDISLWYMHWFIALKSLRWRYNACWRYYVLKTAWLLHLIHLSGDCLKKPSVRRLPAAWWLYAVLYPAWSYYEELPAWKLRRSDI